MAFVKLSDSVIEKTLACDKLQCIHDVFIGVPLDLLLNFEVGYYLLIFVHRTLPAVK